MNDVKAMQVQTTASARDALVVIDRSGVRAALVCDEDQRLVAVCSDGDVRRFLIRGGTIDRPVNELMNPTFTSVGPEVDRAKVIQMMVRGRFTFVPVLDSAGRVLDVHTMAEMLGNRRIPSWAVIMVGGRGTRLGELTRGIPKPMLPVGDRPILEHIVGHLVSYGIHRIFLSVNYLAPQIEDHFGDGSRFACEIEYLREDQPLGTAGALSLLPQAPTHPTVVMNGDLLTRINMKRMLKFHQKGGHAATMALTHHVVKIPYGVAQVQDGQVKQLVEKPSHTVQVNSGIYVLDPAVVGSVPRDTHVPITEVIVDCLESGQTVGAYPMDESWVDIGLPDDFDRAQALDV